MKGTPAQIAAFVGRSERTIWRWIASGKLPHTKLPGGLIEVEDRLLTEPDEQEGALLARLTRIEEKLDRLTASVSSLSVSQPQVTHHVRTTASLPPGPAQGELPENLTPWRDYCDEKGYAQSTVKRAIDRGEIPVHRGKWKRGKVYILAAIDEEGKAAMDALFSR